MPFQQSGTLRWFTFESFASLNINHAVFTRRGGVSPEPWASLNVGGTVGDHPDRVRENRGRAMAAVGISPDSLYDSWQVHGNSVYVVEHPRGPGEELLQVDALVTCKPEIVLMMRFADCVPVMLVDRLQGAIGLVHAGWKGTILGVVRHAIAEMTREFGTRPEDLYAGIGPSIGPDHYEIQRDVSELVKEQFKNSTASVLRTTNKRIFFDLWEANRIILEGCGVGSIEVAGICTACHLQDWFSHRGENGVTGRFGGLIQLGN